MTAPLAIRLLALPCAGASATMYLRWRRLLPAWVHLLPVELPGRGSRLDEPCMQDFDRLVARLCDEHVADMQGPWALFGHSMGGLLAYGIACRQRALGRPLPEALFVSGSPAPSRRDARRFAARGDDAALMADLRKQGGTPEEVFGHAELLRLTLDTLDADYGVCASFTAGREARLPMPLHVLGGRQDEIDASCLEAWRHETAGRFTLRWFDGGHFFIRQQEAQAVAAITRELAAHLSTAGLAAVD